MTSLATPFLKPSQVVNMCESVRQLTNCMTTITYENM